jgi:hypothetical protein
MEFEIRISEEYKFDKELLWYPDVYLSRSLSDQFFKTHVFGPCSYEVTTAWNDEGEAYVIVPLIDAFEPEDGYESDEEYEELVEMVSNLPKVPIIKAYPSGVTFRVRVMNDVET